jgi:pseudouridine synthase
MAGTKLIRYVARSTGLSRREVMQRLKERRVAVNGIVQEAASVLVEPGTDRVTVDGKLVRDLPPLHLMMYKPRATICTRSDPEGRTTVYDLLKVHERRAATVGRLDYNTTGLLLFTSDGELARRLTLPRTGVRRTYRVKLVGRLDEAGLESWQSGMVLDGRPTRPARVRVVSRSGRGSTVVVTLVEGHNRQIHRMARAVGLSVAKIHRQRFAGLTLGGLRPGGYRHLTRDEVQRLRRIAGL